MIIRLGLLGGLGASLTLVSLLLGRAIYPPKQADQAARLNHPTARVAHDDSHHPRPMYGETGKHSTETQNPQERGTLLYSHRVILAGQEFISTTVEYPSGVIVKGLEFPPGTRSRHQQR